MDDEPFARHRVAVTDDLDEARAALESVFPSCVIRPTARDQQRSFEMVLNAVRVGELTVGYTRFARGAHLQPLELRDYRVEVPVRQGRDVYVAARQPIHIEPGQAAVFMPGQVVEGVWPAGSAQLGVAIPEHRMRSALESILGRPVDVPVEFTPVMDLTTDAGQSWTETLWMLERLSRRSSGLIDHQRTAGHLESLLIQGLLLAHRHNYTDAVRELGRPAMPRLVREVIGLIQAHPERPWSTADLGLRCQVSERSVQQNFQQFVGVTPMRYLRDVRLDRVRADLRFAYPQPDTVAEVAARWGFFHLGRFAHAYHERFGEYPSQTRVAELQTRD